MRKAKQYMKFTMNPLKFTTLISVSVTVLCMVLSSASALPFPQQTDIQSNFLVPSTQTITSEPQITGILKPEVKPAANSFFSSVIIDILPQISNFTKRLESRNGVQTSPEEFVAAVTELTYSFIEARARDEGRQVTQKEVDSIFLTEAAFNVTLELVKDMSQGNNIAFAIKRFTDITPRLAEIGASVQGRELTTDEIDDLNDANEMVGVLTPFFEQLSKLNLNAGQLRSATGNLSNYNVDVIQDYANQNLRNLRDFTKSNFQTFKDYNRLQFPEFSSDRAQEYFENNVHRVQDLTRLGLKNAETLPERISPNGASFGKISSQVADIINFSDANIRGTQQINLNPLLDDQEFSKRTLGFTPFAKTLTDRIQQLSKQQSQNSKKATQTVTGIPLFNKQQFTLSKPSVETLQRKTQSQTIFTLEGTSSQSTPQQKSQTSIAKENPQIIQTVNQHTQTPATTSSDSKQTIQTVSQHTQVPAAISSGTRQILPNQNTQTIQTLSQRSQAPSVISSDTRQILPNQNSQTIQTLSQHTQAPAAIFSGTRQTLPNQNRQTIQTVSQHTQAPTAIFLGNRQTLATQNQQITQTVSQHTQDSAATSSGTKQTLPNQNTTAFFNNGNARVVGLVQTNTGLVPLVHIGQHATLG